MLNINSYRIDEKDNLYVSGTTNFILPDTSENSVLYRSLGDSETAYIASIAITNRKLYQYEEDSKDSILGIILCMTTNKEFSFTIPLNFKEDDENVEDNTYIFSDDNVTIFYSKLSDNIDTKDLLNLNPINSSNLYIDNFEDIYPNCKEVDIDYNDIQLTLSVSLDKAYTILPLEPIHKRILKFIKHIDKRCAINKEFINFILNREAMLTCFELGHQEEGMRLYDKLINS